MNVEEFEAVAKEALTPAVYDYIAGGSGDELTVASNIAAFRRREIGFRVLVDVRERDLSTVLLDHALPFPVLLAPTALHQMAHPDGEVATARGASTLGVLQTLSTVSSVPLEDVAAAAPGAPRWFQLYCYTKREIAETLVARAYAAGYTAIVLTVDVPLLGNRERDVRGGFVTPPGVIPANIAEFLVTEEPVSITDMLSFDAGLTWENIPWLRSLSPLPILLKGVVREDDARRAIDLGVDGIWVSNHGGRQLDTAVASLDALPGIAQTVAGRAAVIVDGGVRRGVDVLKAIALGADAVAVGRPQLWGLAAGGADGVRRVLEMLRDELSLAMALAGCRSIAEIDASLIAAS